MSAAELYVEGMTDDALPHPGQLRLEVRLSRRGREHLVHIEARNADAWSIFDSTDGVSLGELIKNGEEYILEPMGTAPSRHAGDWRSLVISAL